MHLNEFFSYYFSAIISFITGNQQHPRRDQFSAYDRSTQDHISRWIDYAGLFGYPRRQCRPQSHNYFHQICLPVGIGLGELENEISGMETLLPPTVTMPTHGTMSECMGVLFNEKLDDVDVAPHDAKLHV